MPYRPYFIALDVVKPETQLLQAGLRLGELAIPAVPDGAELWVKIGNNPDYIQVTKPVTFAPDNDNDANNGVWYKITTPLPGASIQVLVSWAGALNTLLI